MVMELLARRAAHRRGLPLGPLGRACRRHGLLIPSPSIDQRQIAARLFASPRRSAMSLLRLSIFGRLTIGFVAIILVMASLSTFALYQIRQIIQQSTSLVAHHYPAI